MSTLDNYVKSNATLEKYAWNVVRGLRTFTADDLHVLEEEIDLHGRDKRVIGALLKSFERQGLIRKLGYVASRRCECHGRPVLRWEVV